MNEKHTKLVSGIITSIVIAALVISGPATALTLNLSGIQDSYNEDQDIEFILSVAPDFQGEQAPENLTLILDNNAICTFDTSGNESCDDIDVSLIEDSFGYGYGYGYGSGQLKYNITLSDIEEGNHTIRIDASGFSSQTEEFEVLEEEEEKVEICHVPPGNPGNAHTIEVGESAVPAHLAHGDSLGECEDEEDDNDDNGNNNNAINNDDEEDDDDSNDNESDDDNKSNSNNNGNNGNGKAKGKNK